MAKTSKATRRTVQPTEPLYRFGEYREAVKGGIGKLLAEKSPDTEKLFLLAGRAFFDCVYFIPEDQIKIGIMSPVADMEFIKRTIRLETVWRAAKQYHAKTKWPQAGPVEFLDLSERSAIECALHFTDYFVNSILEQRTEALGVFMHGEPQGAPKQKDYDKWIALTYYALSRSIPERCLDTFIRDAKSLWIKIEQEHETVAAAPAIHSIPKIDDGLTINNSKIKISGVPAKLGPKDQEIFCKLWENKGKAVPCKDLDDQYIDSTTRGIDTAKDRIVAWIKLVNLGLDIESDRITTPGYKSSKAYKMVDIP